MKKNNKILVGIGVALATVAIFFFQKKKKDQDKLPPKKAPQLPIYNPGEQSEFTTSASESEIG
jgi:LPXTG-motif cell wall-anchored protein